MKDALHMGIRHIKKKKKDCPKKHTEKIKTAKKNLQDFALIAIRGYIGPGNVSLNMLLKESLF